MKMTAIAMAAAMTLAVLPSAASASAPDGAAKRQDATRSEASLRAEIECHTYNCPRGRRGRWDRDSGRPHRLQRPTTPDRGSGGEGRRPDRRRRGGRGPGRGPEIDPNG